nr:hypothetical protein [Acidimicrobiia bacterium]
MSLEGLLFGTADERRIDELVAEFVGEHLGGRVAGRRFRTVSVGVVLGLHLEDGRNVVVKVHQGRWSQGFLLAVGRAQRAAVTAGLPAPQPLLGPAPLGHGLA